MGKDMAKESTPIPMVMGMKENTKMEQDMVMV